MRLEERLRLLRGDIPQSAPATQKGDLAERLRRLVPRVDRPDLHKELDENALAERLGAEILSPGVLQVERRSSLERRHGRIRLGDCLSTLPLLMDDDAGDPSGWLFLDTETSGLAGGTGTWAFVTGLARIQGGELLLRQYLLARLDAEPAYLEAVGSALQTAGLYITYNGKSFDCPLLTTRLRLVGIRCELDATPHLDLLHSIRRIFARVWPDCRLATAEKRLLGLGREGDLPGAEAPRAWLAWLRRGEIEPLAGVLAHNRKDLLSLPSLAPPLHQGLRHPAEVGADSTAVARHWLARGKEAMAFSILLRDQASLGASGFLELARLHRRRGEWLDARRIWRSLADKGDPRGAEALAKYLEHRERDFVQALRWVDRLPTGAGREQRRRRLESKLRKTEPVYIGDPLDADSGDDE